MMEATLPLYKYEDLNDPQKIRLLYLSPGQRSSPIRCNLKTVLLSEHPNYEALSYAWGDTSKSRSMICDKKAIFI